MYQQVIMLGRLTADPELKQTPSGVAVAQFSIAVDRSYTDKEGKRQADFFNVIAWRKTGEFVAKHFKKGKPILIDGRFENRSYEAKEGGKRWVCELIANNVYFAGDSSGKSSNKGLPEPPPAGQASAQEDFSEMQGNSDDLPF